MTNKQKELTEKNNWDENAVIAYLELGNDDLDNFEESYQGRYNCDEEFVIQMLEDCGDIPKNLPNFVHIDWEKTTRDVMMDYSEENCHYFRNL